MESKFSHFRQRDNSVDMLRVKMSRRLSQSQKENREKVVNARRQLDKLQEQEISSLDASMAVTNTSTIKEITNVHANSAKSKAVEERLKQLARWKERKALQKEKEKQEKERKGVFKTGLYHPKDTQCLFALPPIPAALTKAKETKTNTASSQSTRVTRSMRQQLTQKPTITQIPNTTTKKERPTRGAPIKVAPTLAKKIICPVVPVVQAQSIRSVNRSVPAAPVVPNKPHDKSAVERITRSKATVVAMVPPSGRGGNCKAVMKLIGHPAAATPLASLSVNEEAAEELSSSASFAPKGFVFQAPVGVSAFKFEPLTPRSADAFLTPSFNFPPAPVFNDKAQAKPSGSSPPKSPRRSPPRAPSSPLESKHDVPYFRSEINNETDKLTSLSAQWEPKVEDVSIPEEMRDRMRTAIGQARLLMKERFNQFSGLVDDCELGRGDKLTTCSDLQGFWDMVYFQVEDVSRKFDALKEAEVRGWVEEHKPQTRQRKAVKKPVVPPTKPPGTKAGAKSGLAAIKAAMRAKKQAAEAEEASKVAGDPQDEATPPEGPQSQVAPQATDTVVFDGGFFSVESPARASGYVRRSRRLSAAMPPQASPCTSYPSPRRVTRHSLALAQTHGTPVQGNQTPLRLSSKKRLQLHTPQPTADTSLSFLLPTEMRSCSPLLEETSTCPAEIVSVQESTMCVIPNISVVQENDEAAKSVTTALSFMPSPSSTPCQCSSTQTTSPAVPSSKGTPKSMCTTPDSTVVEEIPGLDFERYLQPSHRCSLSPMEPVTMETLSSMTVDVEMESPKSQSEHLTQQEGADSTGVLASLHPESQGPDTPVGLPK
ncbi:disks large-associated protein 5 isoform X2 [Nerophis ophidion]|uniref:disks large-associated protein 5 isoform X2 n=1 Tax=Nerophis ophidion TaxID=159077 RepID=UPI002AE016A1|nr:disks large-associated protein 5 isoform X2 [Nerophis ophidion]